MGDEGLKINIEKPLKLEPHQEWICNYLDRLNEKEKICAEGSLPSDLVKGALAVALNKKSNPDWMAQAAHSYREILRGLGGKKDQSIFFKLKFKICCWLNRFGVKNKTADTQFKRQHISNIFQILHEQNRANIIADSLYKTHVAFTKISHHFGARNSRKEAIKIFEKLGITVDKTNFPNINDFNNLVQVFENTLKESSLDPLQIHKKIDTFINENSRDSSHLRLLFSLSYDGKRFFFSQADESWLDWLWNKGFLDEIKKKTEDTSKYSYRMSELDYLTRMVNKYPEKVAEIIKSVEISEANYNPEVVYQFMWIIRELPAEQIKTLTSKIRDEKWVYLMSNFHKTGYEFDKIVKKLVEKKENESILELAQAVLTIKNKDEIKKSSKFGTDDPFYVDDIDASGIFEALVRIDDDCAEKALGITSEIISNIAKLGDLDEDGVFEYDDFFSLYDADFFTLEIESQRSLSYRKDFKNIAAVIKKLTERTICKVCGNPTEAKRLFEYLNRIPTSRSIWRLKLFALAQCPETFKEELKEALFKLFDVDNYYEIEGGTEYKKTLKIAFPYLSEPDQRTYVSKVFEYFSEKAKKDPEHDIDKRVGVEIISSIQSVNLTKEELKKCEEIFGRKRDESYEPSTSIGQIRGGSVQNKSPANLANFAIEQIIEKLKSEWTPGKLTEQFKDDDFLNPRGAEGLGEALKEDIKIRTNDYLAKINDFFDRKTISPHYLYSLIRGVEEMLRGKQTLNLDQINKIFGLFETIRTDGIKDPFAREKKTERSWLADWIGVHQVITDTLLYILENGDKTKIHETHRAEILSLISYLFTIKDSPSKDDEKTENAEPYHVAINSVRGRAFEAFVVFTENDGKTLLEDVQTVYREILKDDSLAARFVIGRYLASFYFRGADFITGLFKEIFPKDEPDKKDIYLATWEGYLSNTLYDKLFTSLKDYYKYAITLDQKDYTQRKYLKGLDESLAIHLALAFAHLGVKLEDDLIREFWGKSNVKRHKEFISFIGRNCLTRDNTEREEKLDKDKLIKFWEWALEQNNIPHEVLSAFGFWINPDKEMLDDKVVITNIAKTLEKSGGDIEWDYGLLRRITTFAEKDGEKTLDIIKNYLLNSKKELNPHRGFPFMYQDEVKAALKTIYKNGDATIKDGIKELINTLIGRGSSLFWDFKDIIDEGNTK